MIGAAQQPAPNPTFHAGVTLVRIGIVAKDQKGKPIANLTRQDFQIFDNGWPQEIRLFLSEKEAKPSPPNPREHNIFTNQSAAASQHGYSVILIDSIFTDWGDFKHPGAANARLSALRALRELPPGETIAIYAATRKLQVICEFTSDRALLERQLGQWKASVDTIETSKAVFNSTPSEVLAGSHATLAPLEDPAIAAAHIDELGRASASNDGMDLVADHLAGIPGRKNLIWLSNHFVIGPAELRRLNEADLAVYPVNIDGVTGSLDPLKPALEKIARQTGGVAYDMRNDIDVAIREAVDDGRVSYTLGFYRSGDDDSVEAHHIDIQVARRGVILRQYRMETPRPVSAADLVQALNRPVEESAVPVRVSATRIRDRLNLKAVVDVGSLELPSIEGRWKGGIEIAARFTAADGSPAGAVVFQTLSLNLRPVQQGLGYHNVLTVPRKAVQLKMLFANLASGKIGTVTIPLSEVAEGDTK
jgi:VWFA-related protein